MNLKDLSDLLGLSQTTVSRALNGYPEVSEATRKRVREAADAHGYHPNTRARSLATGRSMAIGHVIPMSSQHEMMNPVFADFIAGAGEVYAQHGYDMLLTMAPDAAQEETYRNLRTKGAVDGLIMHSPKLAEERIDLLNSIGIPYIVHGRASDSTAPYAWVDMNNTRAFRRATDLLLDLGHRRIALVNGLEHMDFAIRRQAGHVEALTARGLVFNPDLVANDEMTESNGYAAARRFLARAEPPTAFLVSSIIPALGVRRAIEEAGLQMGRDISLVTHDDDLSYLQNRGDAPIFTATRSSVREAGRHAAEALIGMVENPGAGLPQRLLEAELILGNSTGPLLQNAAE